MMRIERYPWELPVTMIAAALAFSAIPLALGQIGISWDMLNHHIYLGWTAEQHRFGKDFLPASYQGYQYPYLYWPVYKLAMLGLSGTTAGVVLAILHVVAVPPVWMIARACIPGRHLVDVVMRFASVALAFTSAVVLSLFDSTSNDLLAATPVVWAVALSCLPHDPDRPAWASASTCTALSGAMCGMALAFKLSNAPLVVLLPLLWAWSSYRRFRWVEQLVIGGLFTLAGWLLFYGYWGWVLWNFTGNPFFPFFDGFFDNFRAPMAMGSK